MMRLLMFIGLTKAVVSFQTHVRSLIALGNVYNHSVNLESYEDLIELFNSTENTKAVLFNDIANTVKIFILLSDIDAYELKVSYVLLFLSGVHAIGSVIKFNHIIRERLRKISMYCLLDSQVHEIQTLIEALEIVEKVIKFDPDLVNNVFISKLFFIDKSRMLLLLSHYQLLKEIACMRNVVLRKI